MSEKNQNFHRLAEKRVEAIEDALRIFSNLSGPSYERSPAEVMSYITIIDNARNAALARFQEQKWWRDAGGPTLDSIPASQQAPAMADPVVEEKPEAPESVTPSATFDPAARVKDHAYFEQREARRTAGISGIIREARSKGSEIESLATTVYLQQQVIEAQQRDLAQLRGLERPAGKDQGSHQGDAQEDSLNESA